MGSNVYDEAIFTIWGRKGANGDMTRWGTCFAVGPRHVMTAWHVVSWESSGKGEVVDPLKDVYVVPGSVDPTGLAEAREQLITKGAYPDAELVWPPGPLAWDDGPDLAVLKLGDSAPEFASWFGLDFWGGWPAGARVTTEGYPSDVKKRKSSSGTLGNRAGDARGFDNPPRDKTPGGKQGRGWAGFSGSPICTVTNEVIGLLILQSVDRSRELEVEPFSELSREQRADIASILGLRVEDRFASMVTTLLATEHLRNLWDEVSGVSGCGSAQSAADELLKHPGREKALVAVRRIAAVGRSQTERPTREALRDLLLLLAAALRHYSFETLNINVGRTETYSEVAAEMIASYLQVRSPKLGLEKGVRAYARNMIPAPPDKWIDASVLDKAARHVADQMGLSAATGPADLNNDLLSLQQDGVFYCAILHQGTVAGHDLSDLRQLSAVAFVVNQQPGDGEQSEFEREINSALRLWTPPSPRRDQT